MRRVSVSVPVSVRLIHSYSVIFKKVNLFAPQEGAEILKGEELGKTRADTAAKKTDEDNNDENQSNGDADPSSTNEDEKPAIKKDGTMVATAAVSFFATFTLNLRRY